MNIAYEPRVPRKYIGQYRPRIDAMEKASGKAQYADDLASALRVPGMVYAKVLRSPYAHARIRSLDTSKAAALPPLRKKGW